MKDILKYTLAFLLLPAVMCMSSCKVSNGSNDGERVMMVARVLAIGERIEVEVIESQYTSGPHWVLTHGNTLYRSSSGGKLTREDIKVGDTVEIYYNGQVMLSYPPQIVAHRIVVK